MLQNTKLVQLSQTIGSNVPFWTQGSGGNVSQKVAGHLWIKASGVRLCDVNISRGLACLELEPFLKELHALKSSREKEIHYAELLERLAVKGLGRPSMESGFHAILPKEFVFHFHSLAAVLMAHEFRIDSRKLSSWMRLNSRLKHTILPCIQPGLELSLELINENETEIFVLQNHGVILHSSNENILDDWIQLESKFLKEWGYQNESTNHSATPIKLYFPDSAVFIKQIREILTSTDGGHTFKPKPNAATLNRNALEIWKATEWLFCVCPQLEEIPEDIAQSISQLPTEQFRKTRHEFKHEF